MFHYRGKVGGCRRPDSTDERAKYVASHTLNNNNKQNGKRYLQTSNENREVFNAEIYRSSFA